MRQRQPSFADSLVQAGTLLAQRFRLEALVHRTATATIHLATHRNGSTAWIKLPFAKAHAEQITREASIANTIGSPLLVRDDGTTSDGVPYLILEPPDGEALTTLRARTKAGARLPLARVMMLGDALARVVASVHALGYVTPGLADDDVLAFVNGEVALLDLHALAPSTPEGVAADVQHVVRVLKALIDDVAEAGEGREAIAAVLVATHADVAALQLAWRKASPEPVETPVRIRPGSFADLPPSGRLASEPQIGRTQHATPLAMVIGAEPPGLGEAPDLDGSRIDYLRTAAHSAPPPAGMRERAVFDDPFAKTRELPRLVQAASHAAEPETKPGRVGFVIGASLAGLAAVAMLAAGVFVFVGDHAPAASAPLEMKRSAVSTQPAATPPVEVTPAPVPAGEPPKAIPEDDLQMTTFLRSDGAPAARDVYVDGRVVGKTPLQVTVPCGTHLLQMVAGATKQTVDLPCGGESVVRYDKQGRWALRSK